MRATRKTLFCSLLVGAALVWSGALSYGQSKQGDRFPSQVGSGERGGYVLVWEDLFDGECLDRGAWNVEVNGRGGGNAELQYYCEENVGISIEPTSGRRCLTLTARREPHKGKQFTSGRVNTMGKRAFTHGKVEAYIKLPKTANGLWPAFWLLGNDFPTIGWPRCGEIDILEMGNVRGIATDTQETYMNGACHWGVRNAQKQHPSHAKHSNAPYSLQDGEFHLFTMVWSERAIEMYVDIDKHPDVEPYFSLNIENTEGGELAAGHYFHHDHFILFNLAVGGHFTGILQPDGITALPSEGTEARLYVDFVRVYQKR